MTAKTAIGMSTTANHQSVIRSLILASWESVANGVIVWEHCGISEPGGYLYHVDSQYKKNTFIVQA